MINWISATRDLIKMLYQSTLFWILKSFNRLQLTNFHCVPNLPKQNHAYFRRGRLLQYYLFYNYIASFTHITWVLHLKPILFIIYVNNCLDNKAKIESGQEWTSKSYVNNELLYKLASISGTARSTGVITKRIVAFISEIIPIYNFILSTIIFIFIYKSSTLQYLCNGL